MKMRYCKFPNPDFTEEMLQRDLGCHMPPGTRRVRVEYGFECGCPEGALYFPPDVTLEQMDAVEELLKTIWKSVVREEEIKP